MTASALFNIDRIAEESVREGAYYSYAQALAHTREKIGDSNGGGKTPVRVLKVPNVDTGDYLFPSPEGQAGKDLFQIGRKDNPEFNILFITGVHGEESRLWMASLEALLALAEPGGRREELLSRGQITFDIFSDIYGFDNQTRGWVARDGREVNAPLIGGRNHDRNPYGLGDRNSEQGRNSLEAQSTLTRSNHAAYRHFCGDLTWIGDHHETNENSHYPSHFFRYGGIMLMAHIYFTNAELAALGGMQRAITVSGRVKKFLNDWSPFSEPRYREQVLANHPELRLIKRIRNRVRTLGQRTFEDIHEKALLNFPHVERDFSLDESIWIMGEMYRLPGFLLGPDVLAPRGLTSESFQQDLQVRLEQTLAVMEAELTILGGVSET